MADDDPDCATCDHEPDADPFLLKDYGEQGVVRQQCTRCGGLEFHVAEGYYWTGIRCVKCRLESVAHAG